MTASLYRDIEPSFLALDQLILALALKVGAGDGHEKQKDADRGRWSDKFRGCSG